MKKVVPFLENATHEKPRAAIFLSGGGSNAGKILTRLAGAADHAPFRIAALVTDAPEQSRAAELAASFGHPLIALDIRRFYQAHGETRVSIQTPRGRELREQWTDALRQKLNPIKPDFGILAGFVPLTNLTADFPCLNVHPGDLTYCKDGQRYLVGLHTIPIERAILEGLDAMRSSVIVAQPYSGSGKEMDSGPILGISEPVAIDCQGETLEGLQELANKRPPKRPKGGFGDRLEALACHNQDRLKEQGDWVVFPQVVDDFARRHFGQDEDGDLWARIAGRWHPIETIVYGLHGREVRFRAEQET